MNLKIDTGNGTTLACVAHSLRLTMPLKPGTGFSSSHFGMQLDLCIPPVANKDGIVEADVRITVARPEGRHWVDAYERSRN